MKVAGTLRIARTIVVAVLGLAIALLPATIGVATAAPAADTVVAATQAMPDCEHHRHRQPTPAKQTQETVDHSGCVTGCALCFGFVGADVSSVVHAVPASAALTLLRASDRISSLMGSPPFRPPRA